MHACPQCCQLCTCGGDLDDIEFSDPPSGRPCQCQCGEDDNELDDYCDDCGCTPCDCEGNAERWNLP